MRNSDIADLLLKYHSGHISREEFIRLKTLMEQSRDEEIKTCSSATLGIIF